MLSYLLLFAFTVFPFFPIYVSYQERIGYTSLINFSYIQHSQEIDLSNCQFITCYFGVENFTNTGMPRKLLYSIETIVPGAIVVIGISEYTNIDPEIYKYNIKLHFERYGNETKSSIKRKYNYSDSIKTFFTSLRYTFYTYYFQLHPEIEYTIYTDFDVLVLKNPFDLLKKDPDEVHFMYDFFPYSKHNDGNYVWTNIWNSVDNKIKKSCGLFIFNKTLDDENISKLIPWNSGLLMGKTKYLYRMAKLLSSINLCIGMFPGNHDQGLVNYLYVTGQIYTLGLKFHGHTVLEGSLMSCPHAIGSSTFRKRIKSRQISILHHYNYLNGRYISACYHQVIKFIMH